MVASDETKQNSDPRDFEEELAALEETVARLEAGNMTLEEAICAFERGYRSMKHCYRILQEAQQRVEALCADECAADEGGGGEDGESASHGRSSWKPLELRRIPELDEKELPEPESEARGSSSGKARRRSERLRNSEVDEEDRRVSYADDFAGGDD